LSVGKADELEEHTQGVRKWTNVKPSTASIPIRLLGAAEDPNPVAWTTQ
jgi:hypothetical protein